MRSLGLGAFAALAMSGCVPPSSLFMLTDGTVPSLGEHDLTGGFGPSGVYLPDPDSREALVAGPQFHGDVAYTAGLGHGVGLAVGGGLSGSTFGNVHADVQVRLVRDRDAPFQAMFIGGMVGYGSISVIPITGVGLRAGAILSGGIGDHVRLYGGARLDATWATAFLPTEFENADEDDKAWAATPALSLNSAVGSAFYVGDHTTIGLELAATPHLSSPSFGNFGGALWFRGRFGQPKAGPADRPER